MDSYSEVIWSLGQAHHAFLAMVRQELERRQIRDINNVQALMLLNLGDEELAVGDLTRRGCYLGSNVSYNVKKMVEKQYLDRRRSENDQRTIYVRLTDKGRKLRRELNEFFEAQEGTLEREQPNQYNAAETIRTLRCLDRFWDRVTET